MFQQPMSLCCSTAGSGGSAEHELRLRATGPGGQHVTRDPVELRPEGLGGRCGLTGDGEQPAGDAVDELALRPLGARSEQRGAQPLASGGGLE